MAEKKKCKQCNKEFTVTDEDLAFLEKISPEFNGKKYLIPPSNYCEECRNIRSKDEMTKYDRLTAHGAALLGSRSVYGKADELYGNQTVDFSGFSLFRKHKL